MAFFEAFCEAKGSGREATMEFWAFEATGTAIKEGLEDLFGEREEREGEEGDEEGNEEEKEGNEEDERETKGSVEEGEDVWEEVEED